MSSSRLFVATILNAGPDSKTIVCPTSSRTKILPLAAQGDALQPTSYSPIRQTMSVLAGQGATDSWVMTGALFVIGGCQLATAVGLTSVRLPARILLIVTGLCSIGVAASPEPATGPGPRHLVCAALCAAVAPAAL